LLLPLIKLAFIAKTHVQFLFENEEGQDFFEYLLILAGITLAILLAAVTVPDLFDSVLAAVCSGIEDGWARPASHSSGGAY
jgi:Flp pilus assembly pilin Flp